MLAPHICPQALQLAAVKCADSQQTYKSACSLSKYGQECGRGSIHASLLPLQSYMLLSVETFDLVNEKGKGLLCRSFEALTQL